MAWFFKTAFFALLAYFVPFGLLDAAIVFFAAVSAPNFKFVAPLDDGDRAESMGWWFLISFGCVVGALFADGGMPAAAIVIAASTAAILVPLVPLHVRD